MAEGLMWSLVMVAVSERIKGPLLAPVAGLGWHRGLGLERAVQTLQPAVLLGVPRRDPLGGCCRA